MGLPPPIELRGGQIVLLTGASGAGKSTLLHYLRCQHDQHASWRDLGQTRLPNDVLVIDAMAEAMGSGPSDEGGIVAALEALSRVGLGEVWTYLRTPAQLSEGQRWRLRLALALVRAGKYSPWAGRLNGEGGRSLTILAADEFAAPLDRVTALVVARALRKAVSAQPDLCAIVATSRDDLIPALDPDLIVECDFGIFTSTKGDHHEPQ
jgi:ABC-type ATPase with predicted acetyltransferase domain